MSFASIPRDRWPTLVGIAGAIAVLALLGSGHRLSDAFLTEGSFLGIDVAAWSLATIILTLCLIAQIVLNARHTLARERRLVDLAANLREASAELERLASVDPLTGVLNRRAFFDRLGTEFRRGLRYGRPVAALMIDIDHFKLLNDTHGHAAGDAVLTAVADTLAPNVRESDVIGRYGGEEFAVFLPETTLADGAFVAEKLRLVVEALEVPAPVGGSPLRVTISVGVASSEAYGTTDERAVIVRADEALYEAKRAGRNRIVTAEHNAPGAAAFADQPAAPPVPLRPDHPDRRELPEPGLGAAS
jgi:diguanylate cyclase (GGDEF)-like protein